VTINDLAIAASQHREQAHRGFDPLRAYAASTLLASVPVWEPAGRFVYQQPLQRFCTPAMLLRMRLDGLTERAVARSSKEEDF